MSRNAVRASGAVVLFTACAAAAFAESLGGKPAGPADPTEAVAAWGKCAAKAPLDEACKALRYRVLQIVSEDVFALGASHEAEDRARLLKMLRRPEFELRSAAADAFGMRGPAPAEVAALVEALNDPVPAMRKKVSRAIRNSTDPKALAVLERLARVSDSRLPDTPAEMSALGVRAYTGAAYVHFSSAPDEGRVEFVTSDPPAKVIDFYKATAKKQPMAIEEFGRAYAGGPTPGKALSRAGRGSGQPSAEQIAEAMAMAEQMMKDMQGKSPEEMQRAMTEGAAAAGARLPVARYGKSDVYGAPRVVVLGEAVFLGANRPSLYLVIFEDKALGKTGIAVHSTTTR